MGQGTAPTVTTLAATSITTNSATLNGSVNPNGLSTTAYFLWGTSPGSFSNSTSFQSVGSGTSEVDISAGLTSLTPGLTYYYRAVAFNSAGTTGGSILSFTTVLPNDNFAGATVISTLPYSNTVGSNGATTEISDPTPSCGNGSRANSVWYSFTPSGNLETLIADTFNSNYDTILAVYTGSPGAFTEVACNDQSGFFLNQSRVSFAATAGTTYFFMVTSFFEGGGTLTFHLVIPPSVTTLAASSITSISATLNGSVNPNGLSTTAYFEWGTSSTLASFNSTSGQSMGSGTTPLAFSANLRDPAVIPGATYYFRAVASAFIDFSSTVITRGSILSFSTPLPNDNFAGATVISALPYTNSADTTGATTETSDPNPSCGNGSRAKSVWYSFTPSSNLTLAAETINSNYDTILAAYSGSPGAFAEVACNDQADSFTNQSRISFAATAGVTYHFMITSSTGGGGTLSFRLQAAPSVTTLAASLVSATSATLNGSVNPNGVGASAGFEWGTSPTLAASSTTPFQSVGSDTIPVPISAGLSNLIAGTTYYFRAVAFSTVTVRGSILSLSTPLTNDNFDSATVITALPYTSSANTMGATTEITDPTPSCGNFSRAHSVWYRFTPLSDVALAADTTGSTYDTILAVFTGSPGAFTEVACNDQASGTTNQSRVSFAATAGTTYHFLITSFTGGGGTLTFRLQIVASVTTLAATSIRYDSAVLNGSVNPNGTLTSAWFEWGTDPTLATPNVTSSQSVGSGTSPSDVSAGARGLRRGMTYYYRVVASTIGGITKGSILSFRVPTATQTIVVE